MQHRHTPHYIGITIIATLTLCLAACRHGRDRSAADTDTIALAAAPRFCADTAMSYIRAQCDFGPRAPRLYAHDACAKWIAATFRRHGATIVEDHATLTGWDGQQLPCLNIGASLWPEKADRVLFTAHYDSRAWADNDPDAANHHTPVPAANDGASGIAVMLEMARLLSRQPLPFGVDFVCFDLEDQGTPQWAEDEATTDDDLSYWCLGSRHWAEQAAATGYRARYAVNLDMVGGRGARFLIEGFSARYARPLTDMVWHLGIQLGYGEIFIDRQGGYVTDDHVPVNHMARIPAIDIVPHTDDARSTFGPTWHTLADTPENIDPQVLTAVGQTLLQLLYNDR